MRIAVSMDEVDQRTKAPTQRRPAHSLLWLTDGSLQITIMGKALRVLPGKGLWVPAGTPFIANGHGGARYGTGAFGPTDCPAAWNRTTSLDVTSVLAHLLEHLGTELEGVKRDHAETVILDLLFDSLTVPTIELPMPAESRSLKVATAILANPGSPWGLEDWACLAGTSVRTLRRLFQTETGVSFQDWRTRARVHAAISDLSNGQSVANVARRAGYHSSSAFIRAFRRTTGSTPSADTTPARPIRSTSWPNKDTESWNPAFMAAPPAPSIEGAEMAVIPQLLSRTALAAASLAMLAAGCGSDSDSGSEVPNATSTTETSQATTTTRAEAEEASGVFPVTVKHKYGEITIQAQPSRVVSIGYSDHDDILAFGVAPIAIREWFGDYPYGVWPWAQEFLGSAEPEMLTGDGLNFEQIAALDPDLIVGVSSGITIEEYEILSEIAPTLAQSGEYIEYGMPWAERTLHIGTALGKADEAADLVQRVQDKFAAARAEHPEFVGAEIVIATFYDGDPLVYASQDTGSLILSDLGFSIPQQIDDIAGDEFYATLSTEQFELLDVDELAAIADSPLRSTLEAFPRGQGSPQYWCPSNRGTSKPRQRPAAMWSPDGSGEKQNQHHSTP